MRQPNSQEVNTTPNPAAIICRTNGTSASVSPTLAACIQTLRQHGQPVGLQQPRVLGQEPPDLVQVTLVNGEH